MSLLEKFKQYIISENLLLPLGKSFIAVSGGVDSIVLCELCKRSGYDFAIMHCNFQLRGEESDADELFVQNLAKKYGVDFHLKKFDTAQFASEKKIGIQEAARSLRYEWFRKLWFDRINSVKLTEPIKDSVPGWHAGPGEQRFLILTAHHANDNVETLLMNFFKGTGIQGLQGIPSRNFYLTRPLLFAKKEEILEFAKENKLDFREDSSNSSNKYTRNYFRNELIPSLEKVYPQVVDNLLDNISRFKDIHTLYTQSIESIKSKLIIEKGFEFHIPVLKLIKTEALPTVVFEIIKDFGFGPNQVDEVIKLLKSGSGKYIQSNSHRMLHNRKWLIISGLENSLNEYFVIEENEKLTRSAAGKMFIEKTNDRTIVKDNNIAMLDASQIKFPLLLRKWKQGDYFYPLGMTKKKKLSRFFIDQKLSMNEKENTWVIEMNKKIAWVVGKRIDNRFKITDQTKEIIKLTYKINS